MFSRQGPAALKKDLGNILKFAELLSQPQEKYKTIHVAGTNGKGSTCHMLAAVLQEAGYKVGLYTSPHIQRFTERIKVNGVEIDEQWVVDFVSSYQSEVEEIKPSFFEISVAMAFDYFAFREVDIAIVEVGLGGRLDSTNILNPILSIITNIGLDHTDMLGETLAEIAAEKAGIIKPQIPVIIGDRKPETESVFFAKAIQEQAPILFADEAYDYVRMSGDYHFINQSDGTRRIIELDLAGSYQYHNLKSVLLAIDLLRKMEWDIGEHAVQSGLAHVEALTGIRGRFDIISESPLLVFDVAHNKEGITRSISQISKYEVEQLYIILGIVRDKKIGEVLPLFPKNAIFIFTQADVPRALPAKDLAKQAADYSLQGHVCDTPIDALEFAEEKAKPKDAILVIGSFFILSSLYKQ